MEVVLIIVSICIGVFALLIATFRINELEQQIAAVKREQLHYFRTANKSIDLATETMGKDIDEINDRIDKCVNSINYLISESDKTDDYKTEVLKATKNYVYLEFAYIRNQLKNGNIEEVCEHLKKESAGDLLKHD